MKKLIALVPACILAGCASPNVALKPTFWKNHQQRIAVTTSTPIQASLYQQGSEGLLDLVINQATSNQFVDYLNKTQLGSFKAKLINGFVFGLRARHIRANPTPAINIDKMKSTDLDKKQYSTVDFKPLRLKIARNKILYVQPTQIGATRKYFSFIPIGAPKAVCNLEGDLVNTTNNKILWRYHANVTVPVHGKWDQPPHYPHFTQALHAAMRLCRKEIVDNFLYASNS